MKYALATTVSRRSLLSRLFMAAAVAPVLGVGLAGTVEADKKKKKRTKKERVEMFRSGCVGDGGKATVEKRPGGTTVTCTGSETGGDWSCTVHSKGERCHTNLTYSPTPQAGGGGAVPPTGGNEDPTGSANPGGGGAVPPGETADPDGGGSGPVLE